MRSGRAYLNKRMPSDSIRTLESRDLRHAFAPAPPAERASELHPQAVTQTAIESDLDRNEWSVVSFSGVEAGGLTYSQAARLMDVLGDNGIKGLCIITDIAAIRID